MKDSFEVTRTSENMQNEDICGETLDETNTNYWGINDSLFRTASKFPVQMLAKNINTVEIEFLVVL